MVQFEVRKMYHPIECEALLNSNEPLMYDGTPESRQQLSCVIEYCMHKIKYKAVLKELTQKVEVQNMNNSFMSPLHIRLSMAYKEQKERADKLDKDKRKYKYAKEVGKVKQLKKELKQARATAAEEKYELQQKLKALRDLYYCCNTAHTVSQDYKLPGF